MKGILGDTDVKEEHGCGVVGLESLAFKKKVYVCGLPNKTSVFELVQFFNKYAPVSFNKFSQFSVNIYYDLLFINSNEIFTFSNG